jgi:hypothetical protein
MIASGATRLLLVLGDFKHQRLLRAGSHTISRNRLIFRSDGVRLQHAIAGVVEGKHVRIHRVTLGMADTPVSIESNFHQHSLRSDLNA